MILCILTRCPTEFRPPFFFCVEMGVGSSTAKASIEVKEDGEKDEDADEDEAYSAAPR